MDRKIGCLIMLVSLLPINIGCCEKTRIKPQCNIDKFMNKLENVAADDISVSLFEVKRDLSQAESCCVPEIIKYLENEHLFCRLAAIYALGEIGDSRAVEPLVEMLADPDPQILQETVESLAKLADPRSVEPLIHLWEKDRQTKGGIIAHAISKIPNERSVLVMIDALYDDDPWIRGIAATTLGELGEARAVNPLVNSLKDH